MKKFLIKIALLILKISVKNKRTFLEVECIIKGHQWSTEFIESRELKRPIKERVYCKHCGKYYSEVQYKY